MKNLSAILLALVALAPGIQAQDNDLFKLWPDSTLAKANTASDADYLSQEEKEVIYYMNLCRMNPPLFAETFLANYLREKGMRKDRYVRDLIKYLEEKEDMALLKPRKDLTSTARTHARDMGTTGRTGHNSSDGASFVKRMEHYSTVFAGVNENCNYGFDRGIDVVMDLLIDRDVSNAGHRKNILDPEMRYIGVAIEPHRRYQYNCVQDFGGKLLRE